MNLPQEMGRYIASPAEWSVSEEGDNKIPTFVCRFNLNQYLQGAEWVDVTPDALEITGYFYLFKKDGQPNTFTINALKDALGWDGRSIASLADGEWADTEVQITVEMNTYNGKSKPKIAFINPRDSAPGGLTKAAPEEIISLEQKYGPMLRALNGGAAPAKPAGAKAPAPAARKPAAAGSPASPAEAAKRTAWEAFKAKWTEYVAENPDEAPQRDEKWKSLREEYFVGKSPDQLTAADWMALTQEIQTNYSPAVGLIPY